MTGHPLVLILHEPLEVLRVMARSQRTLSSSLSACALCLIVAACGSSNGIDESDQGASDGSMEADDGDTDEEGGDPGGDPGDGAQANFQDGLIGLRSYGCEPGAEGEFTTEFVEAYLADGRLTSDTWLYEEPGCSTRPLTFSRALAVSTWSLEGPRVTEDGRQAYGIRFEALQQGNDGDIYGDTPGKVSYDLVALEEGGVSIGAEVSTTLEGLSNSLLGPFPATPLGERAATASVEGLQGTWLAGCFNSRIQQRAFDQQAFVETIRYYADSACETFYAETIKTWAVTYGEPVTSVFGQPVMRTTMERVDAQYGDLVIDVSLPEPPPLGENGAVVEDIWGVIDDELVIGTCLDKGPGNCGVGENIPDMLNFNIGNRYLRQ